MRKILEKINSRIAHKLALWVIVFSSVITLMTTVVQLYLDYSQDIKDVEEYFRSITSMQLRSISQSVWILDDKQIQVQLDGIVQGRDIIYAAIYVYGKPQWQSGLNSAKKTYSQTYPLHYTQKDIDYEPGDLLIVASLDNLHQRLRQRALVLLFTNALKIFFFATGVLILFRFAVTRHLEKIASHMVRMDFRHRIEPLQLERGTSKIEDEFSKVVSMLNIFQRRGYNAFKTLEKGEQRLRLFFDATEEGIIGINREERITFVNSACLQMIGMREYQSIIGKRIDDILSYSLPSTSGDDDGNIFTRPLKTKISATSDDGSLQVHGGSWFYASVLSYPIMAGGECTGVIIFFNDISEQRGVLREKNLLRQAVRQSPILIIITDSIGRIEYVNPGFEKTTGYPLGEVQGRRPFLLGRHCNSTEALRGLRKTIRAGEQWQGRYDILAKNGKKYCLDVLISPVLNEKGDTISLIGVCLDITQRLELQKRLNHVQKMEAVGRLSASFAHEFGNPLLGVRSVIGDIRERVPMSEDDRHLLQLAYGECERMKVMIRDFQQFQRLGSGEKSLSDIHIVLDNVLIFYRKQLDSHNIILEKSYAQHLPPLSVRKDQISQVFLNLVINAVDAMAKGGGILKISTFVHQDSVHIEMSDTGIGIAERDRELIFEPFFTTKPEVEGTGLGLAVSYGIISSHGGEIRVRSNRDKGSVFTVSLPLCRDSAVVQEKAD